MLHQLAGLIGDPETEISETGGETRHPQDAHRVFDERIGDVAQQAGLEVCAAAVGIDDGSIGRRRIVSSVTLSAMALIVRSRRLRSSSSVTSGENSRGEAPIAGPDLRSRRASAYSSWSGVQEHREIAPHRQIALAFELFGASADDDPVALLYRQAEQPVPDRAAD